ncbi:TetR/AcrR family transcriptional regulator [Candidatus Enterococcus willemsii]|uniref:TetR family transcriptional regulator n=1 Tax=Candidatus Enterococcus willemsii TaxID=1857215 RepID=A0ABQ6Z3C4_9ENTE|nr:TetR/AcrR family transcriptional regulator [Enterococcus sp. CU12B]KAF1305752.1 TetR family transcriptional regulator [Enterococcus sp. CU12B]
MPSETFFNLPKEKQERILEAARKEFSRVSLNEASIANVIKDAEIPRGSFYQYFSDKEDLYYYYFDTVRRDSHRYLVQAIQQADGDLFSGFETYFNAFVSEIFVGKHALFYKNVFTNMDYHGFRRVAPIEKRNEQCHGKHERKQKHRELLDSIDLSKLRVNDERELQLLLQMVMHTVFTTIADGYRRQLADGSYDVALINTNFQSKLNWLKNGARKEQTI